MYTLVTNEFSELYIMKSTEVQTLGALRMCGTANSWAGL